MNDLIEVVVGEPRRQDTLERIGVVGKVDMSRDTDRDLVEGTTQLFETLDQYCIGRIEHVGR